MSKLSSDPTALMAKKIGDLEAHQRKSLANFPVFDLSSENTPVRITSDQNDYDVGNYDVLRLSTDASRTITGLSGGLRGRWVTIWNIGNYNIVLSNQSTSSSVPNRILSSTGSSVTISPNGKAELYYDYNSKRWRI